MLFVLLGVIGCDGKKINTPTVVKPSFDNTEINIDKTSETILPTTPVELALPSRTITSIPTHTVTTAPTKTPTATNTQSPTIPPSPSSTATATIPPTPTISPTPNLVMPGFYAVGGCGSAQLAYHAKLLFCVNSVTVTRERHMIFNVSWTLSDIMMGVTVTKRSDQGNGKMYLIDNLGNRYNHFAGGGAAYVRTQMKNGETKTGWFEFGTPPEGAVNFSFYDDDNKIAIKGIGLLFGKTIYQDWVLINFPLYMEYKVDLWTMVKKEDGSLILNHRTNTGCSIEEKATTEPQGKLKNKTKLGNVTYEIYGLIDSANNVGIREYLAVSGIPNMDPGAIPFFFVTIPLDNSLPCIQDASEVLATLAENNP